MYFTPRRVSRISVPQLILLGLCILIISLTAACSTSAADEGNRGAVEPVEDNPESDSDNSANASIGTSNSVGDAVDGGFSIDPSSSSNLQEENESAESALATFPSMPIQEENTHLETALAMAPADALQFRFSHWNRLKRHNRVPEMTSDFEMLDRKRFMVKVLTNNQAAAVMDKDFFEDARELDHAHLKGIPGDVHDWVNLTPSASCGEHRWSQRIHPRCRTKFFVCQYV